MVSVTDSFISFQLAGVVAVEVTGGPAIPFTPGRKVVTLTAKAYALNHRC